MSFVDDADGLNFAEGEWDRTSDRMRRRADALSLSAAQFARVMSKAFGDATAGGKQFDDMLKSMALRLSSLAVQQAFKPLTGVLTGGIETVFKGVLGSGSGASSAVTPFASGGVIGAPSYFPMSGGTLGLAGEAGPEAIMPLARGPNGRLGVGFAGGATAANVTVQIATPDAASFRRSEAYITGQIARAVARGQRSL